MQQIVTNRCFGGYGLSERAIEFLGMSEQDAYLLPRTDPKLIWCVATLGKEASGECSKLVITEVPDGVEWEISNCDGWETVEEVRENW